MDPDAGWDRLQAAIADLDRDEIAEAAGNLLDWFEKDGFTPMRHEFTSREDLVWYLRDIKRIADSMP